MPQSLIDEFTEQRQAGQPFGKALKNAIFQAKPAVLDLEFGEGQKKEKFRLWKVRMRDKDDNEPV
jgi:potassium channel subfamily K, other eukaryote